MPDANPARLALLNFFENGLSHPAALARYGEIEGVEIVCTSSSLGDSVLARADNPQGFPEQFFRSRLFWSINALNDEGSAADFYASTSHHLRHVVYFGTEEGGGTC